MLAFSFDGKHSENAIYQKLLDLGLLKEEEDALHHSSSLSKLELPKELPSIEETLMTLSTALKALDTLDWKRTTFSDCVAKLRCQGVPIRHK